jgi:hypothetical protein
MGTDKLSKCDRIASAAAFVEPITVSCRAKVAAIDVRIPTLNIANTTMESLPVLHKDLLDYFARLAAAALHENIGAPLTRAEQAKLETSLYAARQA